MKRIFLLTLALVVLNIASALASVTIKIVIGKRSCDCCGFGICSWSIDAMAAHKVVVEGETLVLSIDASTLKHDQPGALKYLEGKKTVTFEEEVTVPADVVRALKQKGNIVIPPGKYPLSYSGGEYTLRVYPIRRPIIIRDK